MLPYPSAAPVGDPECRNDRDRRACQRACRRGSGEQSESGSVGDAPVVDVRRNRPRGSSSRSKTPRTGSSRRGGKLRHPSILCSWPPYRLCRQTSLTTLQAALDSMQGFSSAVQEPVRIDAAAGSGWPEELCLLVMFELSEEVTLDLDEVRVLLQQRAWTAV